MSNINKKSILIMLIFIFLGFFMAVQFRTTQSMRENVPVQRAEELAQRLKEAEKNNANLEAELQKLKKEGLTDGEQEELKKLKMAAGLTTLEGEGVVVTINDSQLMPRAGESANLYLIHDEDILKVINELRASGAEAICINDQRLVASSEIRCAGATLSVNNVHYAPPYEIKAIGDGKTLEAALKLKGGVIDTLKVWGIQIEVHKEDKVTVPAYKGNIQFTHALQVEEDRNKK